MNSIYSQPAWRLAALGLVVSAAGALGIVSMASAHDRSVPGTQPIVVERLLPRSPELRGRSGSLALPG